MSQRIHHRLMARQRACGGDVLPGDFVRLVSGSTLGLVENISGDHATVADLRKPGHREILPLAILARAVRP